MWKLLLWVSALVLAIVIWKFAVPAQAPGHSVRLRDGRVLGYKETGDRAGAPVLMIHGTPGSRQLYIASAVELQQWGVRLIQVDRPGFGLSTPCDGMKFRDYGVDIEQLLDHLHVAQAGVLGWSAGTPWALALGSTLYSRVSRVGIVGALVTLPEDPEQIFQARSFRNSQVDLEIIRRPDVARGLRLSYADTLRNSPRMLLRGEARRIEAPWDIDWKAIRVPVRFWHGLKDAVTPPKGSRALAERIAGAEVIESPNEGHMLIVPRAREITGWVARGSEAATTPETLAPGDAKSLQQEVERLEGMLKTAGDTCSVRYELARTYAAGHQWREAVNSLEKAVAMKVGLDPSNDEMFDRLKGTIEFERLLDQVRADTPPSSKARVAFTIDDSRLFPEGIAYSPLQKRFLLGSVLKHSLIACTPTGQCEPMVSDGRDGLGAVLGLRISPFDGTLWAVSNSDEESGLFHYSLPDGKLIDKHTISRKGQRHLFNDLVVSRGGDVFITDSRAGAVYWLSHATKRLEVFNPALRIEAVNGIAISEEAQPKLYVAGFPDGITVVDIASRSFHAIAHPADLCLANIDGLYYYGGDLLAIQNSAMADRVVRYHLSRDLAAIKSFQILERRNPFFNAPTTGAIADGALYFMANTHLRSLADGKIKPGARLDPIKVLSLDLNR